MARQLQLEPGESVYVGNGSSGELAGARQAGFGYIVHCNVSDRSNGLVEPQSSCGEQTRPTRLSTPWTNWTTLSPSADERWLPEGDGSPLAGSATSRKVRRLAAMYGLRGHARKTFMATASSHPLWSSARVGRLAARWRVPLRCSLPQNVGI